MNTILIADDEESIRTILSKSLKQKGMSVIKANNGRQALEILSTTEIDLAIIDIRMPEISGLELLNQSEKFLSQPLFIVMTAEDTMENAVNAMKNGAYDYMTKPFDLEELSLLVDRALETIRLKKEISQLKENKNVEYEPTIIGKSKSILSIYKIIGRVANQDITILISGESGTGKELIAKAIHFQGKRAEKPFVAVNCSAIPANLLESELFGFKKGAFSGASSDKQGYFKLADTGTLFLDEIGEMPLELQAKLLRVLQDQKIQRLGDDREIKVDVRIIAATNSNLEAMVQKGLFREDLFFRLNVVPIKLPPLRERKTDIELLANYFLRRFSKELKLPDKQISKEAIHYLKEKNWPGNIRELENSIKRVFVLSSQTVLEVSDFESVASLSSHNLKKGCADFQELENNIKNQITLCLETENLNGGEVNLYQKYMPLLERPLVQLVLAATKNNQLKAASLLGINRNTLRKKIRELRIDRRNVR